MHLTREGTANRLDFDFHSHGGYAIARCQGALELPANYQFTFRVRGEAPRENLEFKLLHGDDVWWRNRRDFVFPRQWTAVATKKRQIEFAWGPLHEPELRHIDGMEVVVTAGSGGKGTVWFTDPQLEELPPTPTEPFTFSRSTFAFPARREFGGLTIEWKKPPRGAWRVLIDGVTQTPQAGIIEHRTANSDPQTQFVWLPDAEGREIRLEGNGVARAVTVEPPSWAPTANDFWSIVAKAARRGDYPRYLLGEQSYWTVVGSDRGANEALIGEDGNVEPFKGGFSIEPSLIAGGKRFTWADVEESQSLADGDLPIPSVTWKAPGVTLTVTAAVSDSSMLQLHYHVTGKATLRLDARPFQVNPSTQWLNTEGGVAAMDPALLNRVRLVHEERPSGAREKGRRAKGARGEGEPLFALHPSPFALFHATDLDIEIPLEPNAKAEPLSAITARWKEQLHRVAFDIPADPRIGDTIRTSVAYMLIHRDGAALQPGSRSYERSWIRDGALMAATLLRLGHTEDAKEFAEWFAKYQYDDGKVPCCVDRRGADPVPENDSHGELIYLVAEIWRLTHDRPFVGRLWPHLDAAAKYIDSLRAANHGAFEGLVTESISHEGYSAKPMHSYWDDLFALKGLGDAAELAQALSHETRAAALTASAASMRHDLETSIRRAIDEHHVDYVPGCAELGDFDATSTAIGISPLNLTALFPAAELRHTFDRYLASLAKPRDDYTPYEMRIIGALIRLGQTDEVAPLVERFLKDRRPAAWNGWGEVVRTEPRKAGFIGDMPHAWVASDFVRSMLDAVVYEREDGTVVVGAGVPKAWLAKPLHVGPIPLSTGTIDVRAHLDGDAVTYELSGTARPRGIVVRAAGFEDVNVTELPARVSVKRKTRQ